jgi:predicted RNA-binding Zn ribbon-like protein
MPVIERQPSSEPQPANRTPAPGGLQLVQAFLNTWDIEQHVDELTTPARLREWLAERRLATLSLRVTRSDLADARALRESLRSLAKANNGMPREADALETLNRIARAANLHLRFNKEGTLRPLPSGSGVAKALGTLLTAVADAQAEGTWRRLKACRQDDCHWVFYDNSKNATGAWCSMSICGARAKMRMYRRRRQQRR